MQLLLGPHAGSGSYTGTIPSALGDCTSLFNARPVRELADRDESRRRFRGSSTEALSSLNLQFNDLVGGVSPLSSLTSLTMLDISDNQLNGTLLPLADLGSTLQDFDARNNYFTGDLPSEWCDEEPDTCRLYCDHNDVPACGTETNMFERKRRVCALRTGGLRL